MEIKINLENSECKNCDISINNEKFQKMVFVFNALDDGWSIKKVKNSFILKKNHEGKQEIFDEAYLETFMKTNFDINKFFLTASNSN